MQTVHPDTADKGGLLARQLVGSPGGAPYAHVTKEDM